MNDKIINTQNLYSLLDVEPYFILSGLLLLTWVFYKMFLKEATLERHKSIKGHFSNLFHHFLILSTLFASFILISQSSRLGFPLIRTLPYLGLLSLFWGIMVFVKTCRLIILQYLFLGSMRHGVPVLVVNIFSLLLSLALGLWCASYIFGLELTPLLATSAAFSIILGLALQDTLGNLFAGISLQVDKSFEIGDWLEVINSGNKTVGQVKEITWRSTTLTGWTEELITLPNRFLANAQISNFSATDQPIVRSQVFRLPYGVDTKRVKQVLLESTRGIADVRAWPEPGAVISETTDSWISFKLVYFIDNYGVQYGVGDRVVEAALAALQAHGFQTGSQRIEIISK